MCKKEILFNLFVKLQVAQLVPDKKERERRISLALKLIRADSGNVWKCSFSQFDEISKAKLVVLSVKFVGRTRFTQTVSKGYSRWASAGLWVV